MVDKKIRRRRQIRKMKKKSEKKMQIGYQVSEKKSNIHLLPLGACIELIKEKERNFHLETPIVD